MVDLHLPRTCRRRVSTCPRATRRAQMVGKPLQGLQRSVGRAANTNHFQANSAHAAIDPAITRTDVHPFAVRPRRQMSRRFAKCNQSFLRNIDHRRTLVPPSHSRSGYLNEHDRSFARSDAALRTGDRLSNDAPLRWVPSRSRNPPRRKTMNVEKAMETSQTALAELARNRIPSGTGFNRHRLRSGAHCGMGLRISRRRDPCRRYSDG